MNRLLALAGVALQLAAPAQVRAQEVFHSVHVANLPTAETLPGGAWLFEISHRFDVPISRGSEALWGLDGPAVIRLGLSYAVTDWVSLGVLRTNLQDNIKLNATVGLFEGRLAGLPVEVAVKSGVAWNTEVFEVPSNGGEENELQFYGQLILNAMLGGRFAVGLVPAYIHNPRILDFDTDAGFALGFVGQVYLNSWVSVFGEWLVSEERVDVASDAGTFGFELETRGHFFKLLLTNQPRINPTQFLGGAPNRFEADALRLGFNITRVLPF